MVSFGTGSFLLFWIFEKKKPLQKEEGSQKLFGKQEKSWKNLKVLRKKHKNFKAIWAVLGHSKPNFIRQTIFWDLGPPPTILVLLRTWYDMFLHAETSNKVETNRNV